MALQLSLASSSENPHRGDVSRTRSSRIGAVVVAKVVVVVGVLGFSVGESVTEVDPWLGDGVGEEVGRATTGGDEEQPFAILMSTSAQFQNCSGTPRPSGGMTSQTGTFPGKKPSGQSYVSYPSGLQLFAVM